MKILLKKFMIIFCLLSMASCEPIISYKTHEEYVEKSEWEEGKGLVTSSKASWSLTWQQ